MTAALLQPSALLAAGVVGSLCLGFGRARAGAARAVALAALGASAALAWRAGAGWPLLFAAGAAPLAALLEAEDEVPFALLLSAVLGMSLLAAAEHLFLIFIGLEMMSLALYLLIHRGGGRRAAEAAVKYFFSGALAASLYLGGMALYYAETGSFAWPAPQPGVSAALGQALMLCAALFKLGAVPFHFWLPDAYEAARPELSGFMSTGVKAAAFLLVWRVLGLAEGDLTAALPGALAWIAGLSSVFANLMALRQNRLARLLAYSSVSHVAFLLAAASAALRGPAGPFSTAYVYLSVYLFMSTGAFLFLRLSGARTREQLKGLASRAPGLCAFFALMLLSLAGVPPTAGFLVKLLVFLDLARAGQTALAVVLALNSLIGLGYYLRLIRDAFLEPAGPGTAAAPEAPRALERLVLAACAAGVLAAGAFPRAAWEWARAAFGGP